MDGMERWKGKVALVTGASVGIGKATAEALARAGMKTVLCARNVERLLDLQAELESEGATVLPVPTDLQNEEEIRALFDEIRKAWGGVDVLINNAGLGYVGTLAEQPPEEWRDILDVNVLALSLCVQEALKDMEGKEEGQIINVSSIAGHRVPPGTSNPYYAISKHAVKAFTDALRMELVGKGSPIRAGMISPGMVETEFHERATKGTEDSKAFYSRFRVLDASDVASAICYMLAVPSHVAIHDIVMRSVAQPH
ncbi:MAG: SDR family NAD(P)-dependent oxidoreductase [SAR324 cluster bacterium]|nr:SDR family NAD(P)-dependent oxidoreductase [SAR324 cluster bacterium]